MFLPIIGGIVAYVGAVLVQTFTKYLKKHQSEADDKSLLKYSNCKVVNTIPANGFGSIVAERFGDSSVSLTAKSMSGVDIKQGVKVRIVEFKDDYVLGGIL